MTTLFKSPRKPDIAPQPEPIEDVKMVEEDAEEARRRSKKKFISGGKPANILSGIASALKKRLGE